MKESIFLSVLLFVSAFTINAQNDTMYIMKNGLIVGQYNVNTEIDSIIFYQPTIEEATSGKFTDARDGNVYNWVQIGKQIWMTENLAYLPSVNKVANGSEDVAGAYYYIYDYDSTGVNEAKATSNYANYGVLYNWTAAMAGSASDSANPSGVQGVCPTGWHLPSDAEWTELTGYLGGKEVAGDKLRETGTTHWYSPNSGATNEYGFTALPGGGRYNTKVGEFGDVQFIGYWWSATESNDTTSISRWMYYGASPVYKDNFNKELGFSIRCVKD